MSLTWMKNLLVLAVLLGTGVVLVATSQHQAPCPAEQHPPLAVRYLVEGTCGPPGVITVRADKDSGWLRLEGAAAVNLPVQGTMACLGLREADWELWESTEPHWEPHVGLLFSDGGFVDGGACVRTGMSCLTRKMGNQRQRLSCNRSVGTWAASAPDSGTPSCTGEHSGELGESSTCAGVLTEQGDG